MSDIRPANCRFRLQEEGKSYPRSSCQACGRSILMGLGNHCRRADLSPSPEVVKELVEALRWYGEQARLARLIHSEGDAGRHAISNDGGKRANAIIAKLEGGE